MCDKLKLDPCVLFLSGRNHSKRYTPCMYYMCLQKKVAAEIDVSVHRNTSEPARTTTRLNMDHAWAHRTSGRTTQQADRGPPQAYMFRKHGRTMHACCFNTTLMPAGHHHTHMHQIISPWWQQVALAHAIIIASGKQKLAKGSVRSIYMQIVNPAEVYCIYYTHTYIYIRKCWLKAS
jgi:hypothetical protein